jgi:cell division protein FtsL
MVFKQTNKGGQMTHGEKMSVLGKIIALQEVMLHTQNEINKLNKQLQEDETGSSKASINRSR